MITFKPNPFQSVNGEEEEEMRCGWHLSEWRVIRGNWLFSFDAFVNLVFSYLFLLVSLVGVFFLLKEIAFWSCSLISFSVMKSV